MTPVLAATTPEVFRVLISKGAKVETTDGSGDNIIHRAVQHNAALKTICECIDTSKVINGKNKNGETPLISLLLSPSLNASIFFVLSDSYCRSTNDRRNRAFAGMWR